MPRLIHATADDPGYRRKGRGKGFEYLQPDGTRVTDKEELKRIRALRIPPAWKNVWIGVNPNGHLQATGIDARGRKQYLYHEEWNKQTHLNKFDRMAGFAKALPGIRKKIQNDLKKEGWPREKVISLVLSILDQTALRIGNKAYEQENGTYGLTTLKRKHLKKNGNSIAFQFKAKGGIWRNTQIKGRKLTRLILECSELPGHEVFQYLDADENPHPIFSQDVNAYLQEISEGDYTAKDFRTWSGTVGAIELFPDALAEIEESPKRNFATSLVRKVADKLGNTISVCKAHYIHPTILSLTERPIKEVEKLLAYNGEDYEELQSHLSKEELIALYVIDERSRS